MTPYQNPAPTATRFKIWTSMGCKNMVNAIPTTILMGLVLLMTMETVTCMKVELTISPSMLLHLHSTHKVIIYHQSLPSNPPPTHTPTVLQLPQLTTRLLNSHCLNHPHWKALPWTFPIKTWHTTASGLPAMPTPSIPYILHPLLVSRHPSNLHLPVIKVQSSPIFLPVARAQSSLQLRVIRVQSIHHPMFTIQWTNTNPKLKCRSMDNKALPSPIFLPVTRAQSSLQLRVVRVQSIHCPMLTIQWTNTNPKLKCRSMDNKALLVKRSPGIKFQRSGRMPILSS
jgi:hypothetical protein